ncbi:UNVERIFIED_CONTAM: hypothetical protein GTU68_047829 [Idotea baltica]|nr:hypothetical protein [Idotea baltica]
MGLSGLALVNPRDFPNPEANKMAAGAEDTLENANIYSSLPQAIADCSVVIASTARPRGYDLPELSPEQAAQMLIQGSATQPTALIFGPERMGLHNDDIQHAKYRVTIPANPDYNSLNMAAAVQTLTYEIYKAYSNIADEKLTNKIKELPTSAETEQLFVHLEKVLKDVSFLRPHSGETMQRIRHLLTRAEPDVLETNIIRGILSSIEKTIDN